MNVRAHLVGDTLAICSMSEDAHTLQLYDVARRAFGVPAATARCAPFRLPPGDVRTGGEVTTAAFSPDGLLLACARNDDAVHVFDVRRLTRPIAQFSHDGGRDANEGTGKGQYGVTQVRWVQEHRRGVGRGLALVSGGGDGERFC
jgi:WD40 repeat protein